MQGRALDVAAGGADEAGAALRLEAGPGHGRRVEGEEGAVAIRPGGDVGAEGVRLLHRR